MDEKKLKLAFQRVKKDMSLLSRQLEDLRKGKSVNIPTTIDTKKVDKNTEKIELLKVEIQDLKKKFLDNQNTTQNNHLDIETMEDRFHEVSELLQEKMTMEINSLRLEFTEEIAKVYDTCFKEIIELKGEINKATKSTKTSSTETKKSFTKSSSKLEETPKKTKKEKLKKIAKWLFVDEDEEDEMEDIKKSVKKQK